MAAGHDPKKRCEIRIFDNSDDLATSLAEYIAQVSELSVKERGCLTIALSGGSLISLLCLTVEDAAVQYEFVIRQLVKARVLDVSGVHDCPKFNLVVLCSGSDGHIASLFPCHPAVELREDWITYTTDCPEPPLERITFTLPVINSASNVAVVATGEAKSMAVHLAIDATGKELNDSALPARLVLPADGKLVWFLDILAASKLHLD